MGVKEPGKAETKIMIQPETNPPPKPPPSPPSDMPSVTPKPPAVPPPRTPPGMPPGASVPPTTPPVGQPEAKLEAKADEQKPESQTVKSKEDETRAAVSDKQLFMADDAKESIKEDDDFVESLLQGVGQDNMQSRSEGDDEGRSSKKRKTQVYSEDPLMPPDVHSETEYPEVDVAEFPSTIEVKASKSTKVDGTYNRMKKASRGKPCYINQGGEKRWYLFWNRKWKIGVEFGCGKSSYAYLKDAAPGVPCEPYPATWEVIDK